MRPVPARSRAPGTRCAGSWSPPTSPPSADRSNGRWQLPLHLDASARAVYDFADPDERKEAYQLVLLEAASPADPEQWLDGTELLRLWPRLYLPRVVRAAWQAQQPDLALAGAGPRVPPL